MSNTIVDRLDAQIAEAEGRAPEENGTEQQLEKTVEAPEVAPQPKAVVSPETVPEKTTTTEEQQKKKRISYKQRLAELRASFEGTVFSLRKELAEVKNYSTTLQEENKDLQKKIQEAIQKEGNDISSLFTDEDKDKVGEDSLDVFAKVAKKASEQAVNPYKEQLEKEQQLRIDRDKRDAKRDTEQANNIFLNRLAKAIPEWKSINFDPKFLEYLKSVDPISGQSRQSIFANAERTGDVGRVAGLMQDYKSLTPPDPMAEHVAPTTTSAPPSKITEHKEPEKQVYTIAQIEKFYAQVRKKLITDPNVIAKVNQEVDLAYSEGRIRK